MKTKQIKVTLQPGRTEGYKIIKLVNAIEVGTGGGVGIATEVHRMGTYLNDKQAKELVAQENVEVTVVPYKLRTC